MPNLGEAHDRVKLATENSIRKADPNLGPDLTDTFRKVRKEREGERSKIDGALSQVINMERHGEMRLDKVMQILAGSAYYAAIISDFDEHRLHEDGHCNHAAMYRLHSRLLQAGRMLERAEWQAKHQREKERALVSVTG